jgi:hypothetical protein
LAFSCSRFATNLKRFIRIVTNVQRAATRDSSGGRRGSNAETPDPGRGRLRAKKYKTCKKWQSSPRSLFFQSAVNLFRNAAGEEVLVGIEGQAVVFAR